MQDVRGKDDGMKYIIEIEDVPYVKRGKNALYMAKGFNSLVFDQFGLDKLTPLDKELEEAYQNGFEAGQHEATTLEYQQGMNDAWGTIIKIALIPYAERSETFDGQQDILSIVQKFSPSEVAAKLREYEQQKADEIKVGDEVCFVFSGGETIEPFIVFSIKDDNGKKYYEGIQTSDGRWVSGGFKYFKTGRHFPQVEELIKAMKGGAE